MPLTDMLIDYIGKQGEGAQIWNRAPVLRVALGVQPPHDPYVAPAAWMARHNPARLALRPNVPPVARVEAQTRRELAGPNAQIENLDWNVGRVRQALVDPDWTLTPTLYFFSDHGDMHGSHGQFARPRPGRSALRIPFNRGWAPSTV